MRSEENLAAKAKTKLHDVLAKVDDETRLAMQACWSTIGPAPTCPHVSEVMRHMHQAQAAGLKKRADAALRAIQELLKPIEATITKADIEAVMGEVRNAFPGTTYTGIVGNVPGVYQRRAAPNHKFQQHGYEQDAALMRVGSINAARQVIREIQHALDELLMQRARLTPSRSKRMCVFLWQHAIASPIGKVISTAVGLVLLWLLNLGLRHLDLPSFPWK